MFLQAPGTYFERVAVGPRPIVGVRTDVAAFIGVAERGPDTEVVAVTSWNHYQRYYGSFTPIGYLPYAVKAFFDNGGRKCLIVRVADHSDGATAEVLVAGVSAPAGFTVRAIGRGRWGNRISIEVREATSAPPHQGANPRFRLRVALWPREVVSFDPRSPDYVAPIAREEFDDLTTLDGHDDEVAARVNAGSALIRIAPGPWRDPAQTPAPLMLKGGDDGGALEIADFLGQAGSGLHGLELLVDDEEVSILAMPDAVFAGMEIPPPPPVDRPVDPCASPPSVTPPAAPPARAPFSDVEIAELQRALLRHCEDRKDRFAILDTPAYLPPRDALTWRLQYDSSFGGVYYPWLAHRDPLRSAGSGHRWLPPSGAAAGVFARVDLADGVHHAPANRALAQIPDLRWSVGAAEQGVLNSRGLNVVRSFPGRGLLVWGARTASSDADWRYVNVRRLVSMIARSIRISIQWSVFEGSSAVTRQLLTAAISAFLEDLRLAGALRGETPEEAYRVIADESVNPPASLAAGEMVVEVYVAPVRPAEFVLVRVGRTDSEVAIEES